MDAGKQSFVFSPRSGVLRKPVCAISQQENIRRVAAEVPLLELE